MKDTQGLISTASDSGSSLSVRHEAFGELVLRFQDMAFACAYAVLGDVYLAEDVAQDAFVVAWQKLGQLREPNAFPGWFKRIVLSQCNRLTRGSRLQIVPLDVGANSPTTDPGPHIVAEKHELLEKVGSETVLGRFPLRTDYENYRDVDGIKQPFLIHWSMPGRIWGRKIAEIRQNILSSDSQFDPPSTPVMK